MSAFRFFKAWCRYVAIFTLISSSALAVEFAGGTGEPNDPYLISTAEQLKLIGGRYCYFYFKLVADIDLDPNIPGNEILDKSFIFEFSGTLDGNGHTISNMVINESQCGFGLGFIGRSSGVVKDVKLRNITILGLCSSGVGALVGVSEGLVLQCIVTGSVSGGSSVGGLVGTNLGRIVTCSAFCNVQGLGSEVGGLVGTNYRNISDCCAIGTVTGEDSLGGLIGYFDNSQAAFHPAYAAKVYRCYAACEIIADSNDSIGGLIGKSSGQTTHSFWDIQVSGQKISAGGVGLPTAKLQDSGTYLSVGWDFAGETSNGLADIWTIAEPNTYPQLTRLTDQYPITQLSGSGTPDDPYEIKTARDLVAINNYDISAHYILIADIDMSGMVWSTAPIFHFKGTFNGQGHTISNLTIEGGDYLGLFGRIMTHGVVTNLTIQDAYIIGYNCIGALAGESYGGNMTDCYMTGNVTGVYLVGGLFGFAIGGVISDCTANAVLSGNEAVDELGVWTADIW